MHGLVFVTWEKYLTERFSGQVLTSYRNAIGATSANAPLVSRVYSDEALLAGVGAAHKITGVPADTLLREYGRYFINNGLTSHLCSYLLAQVTNGRQLLLTMRDAHEQISRLPGGLTPPLFGYEIIQSDPHALVLLYDSPRQLCPLLYGSIEGAAELYGEQVRINERQCMRRGDAVCRFELHFTHGKSTNAHIEQQYAHYQQQQRHANYILTFLPWEDGITLAALQQRLKERGTTEEFTRPAFLLDMLRHLHHAGLVATSANEQNDSLMQRRYWRVSEV